MTSPEAPRGRPATTMAIIAGVIVTSLLVATVSTRAAWDQIAQLLSLQGKPEPASANVLSEHETEALDAMPAQAQAELLLERAINHYAGAMEQVGARVDRWRGQITLNERLTLLFTTAINSDDVRVRAAGVEGGNAARKPQKK